MQHKSRRYVNAFEITCSDRFVDEGRCKILTVAKAKGKKFKGG